MAIKLPDKPVGSIAFTLRFPKSFDPLDDDQLLVLSSLNRDLRFERNARGELIVMPPTGTETGDRDSEINMQLRLWAKRDGRGKAFGSSTGFRLPNGAVRSPDASWVSKKRLEALSEEELQKFAPLCPEFVVELRSPSDSLKVSQEKMEEYIANGAELGWLLDPEVRRVYVYTPNGVTELDNPGTLSGDPLLEEFVLDLTEVW
jgi:Uma2 family endonuclease